MDPLTLALIGGGANVAGGIIGNEMSSGDRAKSLQILNNIYNQYSNLKTPGIAEQEISPEMLQQVGLLDPAMMQQTQLSGQDNLSNVHLDPRLQNAQMQSLEQLQKIAGSGFTPEDKAALQLSLNRVEQDANARNQAMLQQQDMRGVGSSDAAMAARLQQGQSSANRAATEAMQTAVEGRNRALQAMSQSASLAGNIQNADYGRQADLAKSQNSREFANAGYENQANQMNTGAKNAAQQFNLQNQQSIANQNVGMQNDAQKYNKQLIQQQYQNQLAKLAGMSGSAQPVANAYTNSANRTAQQWNGIGQGVGQGAAAYGMGQQKATAAQTPNSIFGGTQDNDFENSYQNLMKTANAKKGY